MSGKELINYLDQLLFNQTGKHIDNLQLSILKGVLNGQKYRDIAEEYQCTTGHVRDKGYELLKILSEALEEDINKYNFQATIERLGFTNTQHQIVENPIQIGKINLCSKREESEQKDWQIKDNHLKKIELKINAKTIKNLRDLGLTSEQIAEALDILLEQVDNFLK